MDIFSVMSSRATKDAGLVKNSGDPTPSREDMIVTEQLTEGGKILGIAVLDHIIVASEDCVSIREHG